MGNTGISVYDVVSSVKPILDKLDSSRNEALKVSREVIRASGWAITSLLSGDAERYREHMKACEENLRRLLSLVEGWPQLRFSGFVYNAEMEYVEAVLLGKILFGEQIVGPEELGVHVVPFLQGLSDVVGELRRHVLELLRKGEYGEAIRFVGVMEEIYLALRSLDYPEAIVPGLRHKVDVARRLVDSTKALAIDLESRHRLIEMLESMGAR